MKPKLKIIKGVDLHDPDHRPAKGILCGIVVNAVVFGLVFVAIYSIIYLAFGR